MKNTIFTGAGVAIITPMLQDGSVDFEGLKKLIDFQIDNGTDAIIICGTTGESSTLSDEDIGTASGVQLNTPTTGFRSLPEQAATIPSMPLNFLRKHRNSVQMACCW